MKLFLHCCCGPCYLGVHEGLVAGDGGLRDGDELLLWYYNPNIHPADEEERRWQNLVLAAAATRRPLVRAGYEPERHLRAIAGHSGPVLRGQEQKDHAPPCRCLACYHLRLEEAARTARERGFDTLSTTLLVSPWQRHEDIVEIGREAAAAQGLAFLATDFRVNYRAGQEKAKVLGLYRQKYCGCAASRSEALEQEESRAAVKAARKEALRLEAAQNRAIKEARKAHDRARTAGPATDGAPGFGSIGNA